MLVAGVFAVTVAVMATDSSASSSSTPPVAVPLYPLDEFIGRWNEANALVADQMSPSVHVPIDASALVLRPIDEQLSYFDWHVPVTGYIGGLLDSRTGNVYLVLVAGEPENPFTRSVVGTLLFMLTADRPDDTATLSAAYLTFSADPQPGRSEYVVAGPLGISMLSFDGVEPERPWVAVAAASPGDEARAIADAEVLSALVASTAIPPAPSADRADSVATTAPVGTGAPIGIASTTTAPAPG